ncbi:MAG: peptidoglycan DD-metalloendopeptidase family protein [Parcubacteria group bacterium]|nr:peptidoglycan DD-metalloendopeptidase family protein [Parcubacteria group bacterium]
MKEGKHLIIGLFLLALALPSQSFLFAQVDTSADAIGTLNLEIDLKRNSIDQLNRQIDVYETKIEEKQNEAASLLGEVELLENRIAKTELDIEAAEASIDLTNAEIAIVANEIHDQEEVLNRDREMIAEVLREVQVLGDGFGLQILFGTESFSQLFDELERLENVSTDLKGAADHARDARIKLEAKHASSQAKKEQLLAHEDSLVERMTLLDEEQGAKEALVSQTRNSEAEFRLLLNEVNQEQTFINQQISALQAEIEGRLNQSDEVGDSSILSWPINPTVRGISATFHDPTYPFRHLFEHSGLDLPAPTGTPVSSVAPGYVAWTRKGRLYGNYIMVIHTNGVATLYAHLSSINVSPDQFVARGQQIGAVGSTGFSTGPHLHFEVRKNGIPTNPINYLISY